MDNVEPRYPLDVRVLDDCYRQMPHDLDDSPEATVDAAAWAEVIRSLDEEVTRGR